MSHRSKSGYRLAPAQVSGGQAGSAGQIQPRRKPLQERAQATVAAITEAAEQLLVERGYAKVSTNLIARRAGVSVGSLYQYFPNKESIYAAILDQHVAEMHALGQQALKTTADISLPFPVALREVLWTLIDVRRQEEGLMRALESELRQVFPQCSKSEEEDEEMIGQVAGIIADRPDCHPADPLVAARLLLICCKGVTYWLLHQAPGSVDATAYVDQTVRMCELAVGYDPDGVHGAATSS